MLLFLLRAYYEVKFSFKNSNNYISTTILYIIILVIFPVSLQYQPNILYLTGLPILCVSYFIVLLFTLEHLFTDDKQEGSLTEFHFIANSSIYEGIVIKLFVRWILLSLCICIGVFVGFILFNIEYSIYIPTIITLIITVPILLSIGSMSSALLVGLKEKGMLLSLLTIPFYIPVLIITLSTLNNILNNNPIENKIYAAITFFILIMLATPGISTYALKTWSD